MSGECLQCQNWTQCQRGGHHERATISEAICQLDTSEEESNSYLSEKICHLKRKLSATRLEEPQVQELKHQLKVLSTLVLL